MDISATLRRAIALCTRPAETWVEIARAGEPPAPEGLSEQLEGTPAAEARPPARDHVDHLVVMSLFAGVAFVLFALALRFRLGPLAGFMLRLVGLGPFSVVILAGGVWVLAWAARLLAPSMESKNDPGAALVLAAYATTPSFAAAAVTILDGLFLSTHWHRIAVGGGALGTFFLLYHGVGPILGTPPARRLFFAGALALAWLVLSAIAFVGPRNIL